MSKIGNRVSGNTSTQYKKMREHKVDIASHTESNMSKMRRDLMDIYRNNLKKHSNEANSISPYVDNYLGDPNETALQEMYDDAIPYSRKPINK